jgi:hypothetical protein
MRLRLLATAALLSLALVAPTAPASAAPGPLRIAELLPIPDATQGQREFIEVWNPTDHGIDLAGWKVRDAPTASGAFNEFMFSTGRLAANQRIVVWSNGSADARGPSWSTSPSKTVWNDAGDAVTLLDANGTVADWFAYGNSAMAPPAGFEGQAKPAAPVRGSSVALDGATWTAGVPSPGFAPGEAGGSVGATVVNVAPTVQLSGALANAKPGQTFEVTTAVADANGAADVVSWTLTGNGATLAQGATPPTTPLTLTAPAVSGPWLLDLAASDAGGLTSHATQTVTVHDTRLSVQVASGLLHFPDLHPGDRNVSSTDSALLRNEGSDLAQPLLDVSPFSGVSGEIAVDGNLWVGLQPDGGNTTWLRYGGPLTALPAMAPGTATHLWLRLDQVPTPLAAGAYGTTFAVVPA